MKSQELRKLAPELDSLRLGSGWSIEDLSKPQIIVESSYGHSHPGSAHLNKLVEEAGKGISDAGGRAANYYVTDICDGEAQGHDGMNYSLVSRDIMAAMMEIHVKATPFDAGIFITSCDKSVPAHLMAIARLNMPALLLPGGIMKAGPNLLTLEQIGTYSAQYERKEISEEQFLAYKKDACPTCGACSFMGTVSKKGIWRWISSNNSGGRSMPSSCAMAGRCSRLLLEPAIAACTIIAFLKASIDIQCTIRTERNKRRAIPRL